MMEEWWKIGESGIKKIDIHERFFEEKRKKSKI